MINHELSLGESFRLMKAYGKIGVESDSLLEFAWVINQIVREDLRQLSQITGETITPSLHIPVITYIQRTIEFAYIYLEVFLRGEYQEWKPNNTFPRIIDLGGDPGAISVLYWKYIAPQALITVVEANPATAAVMQRSLERRGLSDIEVLNAIVVGNNADVASLNLHRPGKGFHTQDYVSSSNSDSEINPYKVDVPTVQLSSLIKNDEQVDLLKVDIEGAEGETMRELWRSGKLWQVNYIIMEFHHCPVTYPSNSILEMLDILGQCGFSIEEAHITMGKGLRKKIPLRVKDIPKICTSNQKIYLTFSAQRI